MCQPVRPFLEFAVPPDRLVHCGVVDDLGHDRLLLLQVGEERVETACRQDPVAGQHVEVSLSWILWQVADLTGSDDASRVGFTFPGEDAHRGGLTCAIAADEADPVSRLDAQRGTLDGQQRTRASADL